LLINSNFDSLSFFNPLFERFFSFNVVSMGGFHWSNVVVNNLLFVGPFERSPTAFLSGVEMSVFHFVLMGLVESLSDLLSVLDEFFNSFFSFLINWFH
jgi:hypothetical protein